MSLDPSPVLLSTHTVFTGDPQATAKRFLLIDQGVIAFFINFGLNWGIAWGVFRKLPVVPLHGDLSLTGDTMATCWMLPLISCLIVTSLTRLEMRHGRLPQFSPQVTRTSVIQALTRNIFLRALGWGLAGRLLIGPAAVALLESVGVESLELYPFLLAKALFACALGMFFCPLHAWWAMHDPITRKSSLHSPSVLNS